MYEIFVNKPVDQHQMDRLLNVQDCFDCNKSWMGLSCVCSVGAGGAVYAEHSKQTESTGEVLLLDVPL